MKNVYLEHFSVLLASATAGHVIVTFCLKFKIVSTDGNGILLSTKL